MPESVRPLEFTGGFVGPPVPRSKTGTGCPEWQNLALTPEGTSLMPMPGWHWTYPYYLRYKPYVGLNDTATVAASGDIAFSNQPSAGDTLTIGTAPDQIIYDFYTGTYSGSNVGVLIGDALANTLYNLNDAIKGNSVEVNPLVVVASSKVTVTARSAGVAGNDIALAESSTVITVPATLSGGVDEVYAYSWYATSGELATSGDVAIENKHLVVVFPPQAFLTNGGQGLGIVDQVTGRLVALAFHPGGATLDSTNISADRLPKIVGHLNRQGAHDYPKLMPFKDLTFVITPWDEIRVWDGMELRLAGVRAPQTAPGIQIEDYLEATTEETWADNTDLASMTQSTGRSALRFGTSSDRIAIVIPYSENVTGELAFANIEQTAADSQMVIGVDIEYRDNRASGNHKVLPAGTLALVVGNSTATGALGQGAGTVTFSVDQALEHGKVYRVEFPFTETWPTLQAFAWRLEKTIPNNHFTDTEPVPATADLDFRFRLVYKSVSGEGLLEEGEYLIGFSWFDRARIRESNVSPLGLVTLGSNAPVAVDLSGYRSGMGTGMLNSNPDPRHVDAVRVYLHRTDWGTDSYGYPQLRLYQEFDAPQPDGENRLWVYLSANRDLNDVAVDKEPEYERGVLPPCSAAVVDGARLILANQPSYSVGRVFNPIVGQTMYKAYAWTTADGVICYADGTADPSSKTFAASPTVAERWYNTDDPTEHVWCASDPSSLTWTAYPNATPEFGPWFEGREIRFGATGDRFRIVKALINTSGVYDRLWVQRTEVEGSISSFQGPWNTALAYEIVGQPNRLHWSAVLSEGIYIEGQAQSGYQDLEMPGDEVLALERIGDFLGAIGRKMTIYLRQILEAVDGTANPQNPFPGPRSVKGGTVGSRTVVEIANRQALWMSPELQLMAAGVDGVVAHPLSAKFHGYLTSQYRVDANKLRFAHAVYDIERNWYVLFLCDSGEGPTGADTSDKRGDWPDAPPLDRFVEWDEVIT